MAKEKGLEPLAALIRVQNLKRPALEEAEAFVSEEKGVADAQEALSGASDIIAEEISDNAAFRLHIRKRFETDAVIVSEAKDSDVQSVYEMYYEFSEKAAKIAGHRVLALNRGEKEKILNVSVEAPDDQFVLWLQKQIIKKVKYIDGKAKDSTVVSEKVTKKPVNEVTLIGTKGAATTGGAGTFTDENGVTVAYKEVFTGSGTAYTAPAGAGTATGVPAYHGGVAIDPNLIPYGSKLYVVSTDGSMVYGYCTAVDTGGFCDDGSAIVDVFYNTYDECVNWGRRDVNVYVIE